MYRAIVTFVAMIALTVGVAVASSAGDSFVPTPTAVRAKTLAPADPVALPPAASAAVLGHQIELVGAYVTGLEAEQVGVYLTAVHDAEVAATVRPNAAPMTYSGGDSCYGGPIPDYIVTRESGGNPYALNPSGAWGCFQIMPEWWNGACSGFDKMTVAGQKQCAAILWNGGAGASNWGA